VSEHAHLHSMGVVKHPIQAPATLVHCRPAPGSTQITLICLSPQSADMASATAHSGGYVR